MFHFIRSVGFVSVLSVVMIGGMSMPAMSAGPGPADGYDLHVQAPHLMANGEIGGPFHHYCKEIPAKKVFQIFRQRAAHPNCSAVARQSAKKVRKPRNARCI